MNFTELDGTTREWMLLRFEAEESGGSPYRSEVDQRGQDLRDLTQADLDRWLTDGTSTRRAVRYFLQWAHGRGLAGDLDVPLPPRQEPERLLAERDHIHQLDRCLTDDAIPLDLRVGGALVLLFGMLLSRITQLTKDDVIEDNRATWLVIDGHRLMLPAKLARLVRQLRDRDEPRWTLGRLGTPVPWLFPGQSPARPAVDVLFGVRLHRYGIDAHAGRNTAQRTADDCGGIGSGRKLTNPTR